MEWSRLNDLRDFCGDSSISNTKKVKKLRVFLLKGSQELDKILSWTTKLVELSRSTRLQQLKLKEKVEEICGSDLSTLSQADLTRHGLHLDALRVLNYTLIVRSRRIVAFQNKVATLKRTVISKLAVVNRLVRELKQNQ